MTGPEHFERAEDLIRRANAGRRPGEPSYQWEYVWTVQERVALLAEAQVHATLAVAATIQPYAEAAS
jgi:hypothetical protein